jgi:hypothetical protein
MDGRRSPRHSAGMIQPIPRADELLAAVKEALGPERLPLIIGIDGSVEAGKTRLAAWLWWQLGIPVVHSDGFIIRDTDRLEWRYEDLGSVIHSLLDTKRPMIVEGVCLRQALRPLDLDPDFLVWLENESGPEPGPHDPTQDYMREFRPRENADFRLTWPGSEPERSLHE